MAESQPQHSTDSPPRTQDEQSLEQPKDAMPLQTIGDTAEPEPEPDAEKAPTIPPKDNDAAQSSSSRPDGPTEADDEAASKGKDKEEAAQASTDKIARQDSLAIESSEDAATGGGSSADGPVCNITLLLPTGARHPYRLDEKYLTKRNVDVPDLTESGKKDPFSISIYKLKELILREWREEWDGKPASPSSIRLIHFGKLLEDKEQLKKYQFSADSPNVVHMSVRPAEMMEEDEQGKGKSSGREGRSREGGSGCCVIL